MKKVVATTTDDGTDTVEAVEAAKPLKTRRKIKQVSINEGRFAIDTPGSFVLNPDSGLLRSWDVVIIVLLIYTALVTPFEVALLETSLDGLWVINRLVDFLFIIDMLKNFVTAYKEDGMWVVDNYSIGMMYIKSWFVIDLLSILPVDTVGLVMGSDTSKFKALRIVRLLRLMKLLRIIRAARILKRWEARVGVSFGTIALVKFGIMTLSVAHWFACFFRLVPDMEDSTENWLTNYYSGKLTETGDMIELKEKISIVDQYITSFYWSWMTITTIGYGDVVCITPIEKFFAIISMIVGAFIYAYIVGGVCGIIANKDQATANFYRRMDDMNLYMSEHNVPAEVRVRMRSFQINCRELTRQQSYYSAVNSLSPKLRGELMQHTSLKWISRVRIFYMAPELERVPFMQMLASLMKPRAFSAGEVMMRQTDPLHHMLCIQRGVASQMMDGTLVNTLTKDSVVGEDLIIFERRRSLSTVRAVTFVLAYELKKSEFISVLRSIEFAGTRQAIRKELVRRVFRERFKIYAFTFKALESRFPSIQDRHRETVLQLNSKTAFNYHNFTSKDLQESLNKEKPLQYGSSKAEGVLVESPKETKASAKAAKSGQKLKDMQNDLVDLDSALNMDELISNELSDDPMQQMLDDWSSMKEMIQSSLRKMDERIQDAVRVQMDPELGNSFDSEDHSDGRSSKQRRKFY